MENLKKTKYRWINQHWLYVFLWIISLVFFIWGHRFVGIVLTKDGRPQKLDIAIPQEADSILYFIDRFDLYDEKGILYNLQGWAFSTDDPINPTNDYLTEIIFISDRGNILYSTRPEQRGDVVRFHEKLNLNIQMPGFSSLINKELLKPDQYSISILLTNKKTGSTLYINTNKVIIRSPNSITMVEKSASE